MKKIFLLIALLSFSTSLVRSDFFDLCQTVQKSQVSYTGKCTLNAKSLTNALNETAYFIIESDPSQNLDNYLRNVFFVGSADYFKALYFPQFEKEFKNLINELILVADIASNSVSNITLDYLFTSHIRSGFDKAIGAIQKLNQDKLNEASQLYDNGTITYDEYILISNNQTCSTGSYCDDIKEWLGLENLDQVKNLSITAYLKQTNEKYFKRFANLGYNENKTLIDKFLENLDRLGTNRTKVADLIEIFETDYMKEIIFSFDETYTTKRATRTSTVKTTQPSTTKKPKVDINLIAVQTGVLVGVPLGVLAFGIFSTVFAMYFWYNFVPVEFHLTKKSSDVESKLPDNMYEMASPPQYQYQNYSQINNIQTISLNNDIILNKF